MHEALTLVLAWVAGGGIGAMFFGGLWWTVQRGVASRQPALWFLGSLLLRMSIALAGFHAVSGARWQPLLLCLLGFVMARLVVTWLTRPTGGHPARSASGKSQHVPGSRLGMTRTGS
jgi:F1F0 ATPase subunit 2